MESVLLIFSYPPPNLWHNDCTRLFMSIISELQKHFLHTSLGALVPGETNYNNYNISYYLLNTYYEPVTDTVPHFLM